MKNILFLAIPFLLAGCELIEPKPANPRGYQFGFSQNSASQIQGIPLAVSHYFSYNINSLPSRVILNVPPVINQGSKQSCVSVVTGYYATSYYKFLKEFNNSVESDLWYAKENKILSPDFLYNQIRRNQCDKGTSFVENTDVLKTKGISSFATMPYDGNSCGNSPSSQANNEAQQNKISQIQRVNKNDINELKYLLLNRIPILIGIQVHQDLMELEAPFVLKGTTGEIIGQHALTIIGYSDEMRAFYATNSWGNEWGNEGRFWISYDFLPKLIVNDEAYIFTQNFNFEKSNADLGVYKIDVRWETLSSRNGFFNTNRDVSFDLSVVNYGIESTEIGKLNFAFVFSKDNKLDRGDVYPLFVDTVKSSQYLDPKRYVTIKNFKASIGEGQFIEDYPYLIVVVDALDKVKEIDETNNYYAVKIL